jgi:hypothetical protein
VHTPPEDEPPLLLDDDVPDEPLDELELDDAGPVSGETAPPQAARTTAANARP